MPKSLYIIDGHAQIFRAYYAPFARLNSPSGEPTKATFVFCQMLLTLLRDKKPDYLALALDVSDETVFRRDIYPEYKAHREPPPEDFEPQAERIIRIVQEMNLPTLRLAGYEADDLMATVCTRLAGEDLDIYLVSKDKDLEQLITAHIKLYDPAKDEVIGREELLKTKGFTPEQVIDVQTLAGDTVDNVPGVQGIGVKTAAKLIQLYGSAEAVIASADKLSPKQRDNVKAFAPRMPITRQLVTLKRDVEFPFDLAACAVGRLRLDSLKPVFQELGFNRLMSQLAALEGEAAPATVSEPATPAAGTGNYHLVDSPDKLDAFAAELSRQPMFAFDTETTGLNPVSSKLVGLSFAWRSEPRGLPPRSSVRDGVAHAEDRRDKPGGSPDDPTGHTVAYYIAVRSVAGPTVDESLIFEKLKPILEDPARLKVAQHAKYDMAVLRQIGIRVAGVVFDPMLASFVLDPMRRSHGLDWLAWELFGHRKIPTSDLIGKGKSQVTMDEVDTRRVCEYACEDADYTWRLYEVMKPQLDASPGRKLFEETEMPLVEVLCDMECNGVALDKDLLARLSSSMADRLGALTKRIHEPAGHAFNIDSTKQLANVLFEELGLKAVRKTKTGVSTDADTLESLARSTEHPILPLILEYRELVKLKSTYIDILPKMVCARTGRIHAGFHQTGAITGRLSSSDPNLQNIPIRTEEGRQIRGAFVAGEPGCVLLTADYSQIELRILAHFCKDRALLEAFQSGQDIHAFVAAQVNAVPIEQVTKEQRSRAKAVNFGIIYGQTAFGLSKQLNISRTEAATFIEMYFMRYPGIRLFIERTIADAKRIGCVETILGRRRPLPELNSGNPQQISFGERIAVNTVIQGSAADLIKRAMIDIHREIEQNHRPSKMLIQVHDELVFEVPEREVEKEAEMIRHKMTSALPLDVPIAVDIAWGRNWLETK